MANKHKKSWKIRLGNKSDNNYGNYKIIRDNAKKQVIKTKKKAWTDFDNKVE